MFRLRFFGGFAAQRRAFLASREPAAPVFHRAVEDQLQGLVTDLQRPPQPVHGRYSLLLRCARAVLPLVLGSAFWNMLSALTVLGGVLASREVLHSSGSSLAYACALSGLYLLSRLAQSIIDVFDVYRRAQLNRGIQIFLFRIVNRKIAVLDPALAGQFTTGRLKTLIGSDVEAVEDFLSAAIMQWVPAIVMMTLLGGALYWLAGLLGLFALALAVLSVPLAVVGGRLIELFQGRAQREQDGLTTLIGEWVRNIRLVRYLGWQRAIESEVSSRMGCYCREYAFRHTIANIVYGITFAWWMVPILGMLAASSISGRVLGIEAFFSVVWILNHLMNYIQFLPYSLSLYGAAAAGADRIVELLEAPEITRAVMPASAAARPDGAAIRASFSGIALSFDTRSALHDLSLTLDLRRRTAIVGPVGGGKSSLLELLIGERIPSAGTIEIEFENGRRGSLWEEDIYRAFRAQLAFSPQQPFLSNALMRDNIDLGGQAGGEAVEHAARQAQLAPDLALLPLGLDQEVGETGINLSGGQKQRVSLARAFLSKRPLFILDDPLSAVDAATETALMDQILDSSRGLVLVSHRLSELARCDRVLVLSEGRVVEDGSPLLLAADKASRFSAFLRALEEHG